MLVRYAVLVRLQCGRPAYSGRSWCAVVPITCRTKPEQKVLPHATNGRQDGNTGCKGAVPGSEPHKTSFLLVVERQKLYSFAMRLCRGYSFCDGLTRRHDPNCRKARPILCSYNAQSKADKHDSKISMALL